MAIHSQKLSLGLHALAVFFCFQNSCVPTALAFVPSLKQQQNHLRNSPAMAPVQLPYSKLSSSSSADSESSSSSPAASDSSSINERRRAWVERSLQYYSKVMREERRRALGQIKTTSTAADYHPDDDFIQLAGKHYYAWRKIQDGKAAHAESIYRRIIDELLQQNGEEEECDHAKLACTTLLLALLMQGKHHPGRAGPADPMQTRSVFLHFFRLVQDSQEECACSAKVLQAYALFEMRQGNALKSWFIVQKAVRLDPSLRPVLKWKQFRDAHARQQRQQRLFLMNNNNGDQSADDGMPAASFVVP